MRKFTAMLLAVSLSLFQSICEAKNLNLYDQPKSDAKVVGSIDPANGIVPIYTPKEGGWVKVGNPTNGMVGWVKASDLAAAATTSSGFSFSQTMENTGSGPNRYVFQLGIPALTKEQTEALYKQMQAQQAIIQKAFQGLFVNTDQSASDIGFPVMPPVAVEPQKKLPATPNK